MSAPKKDDLVRIASVFRVTATDPAYGVRLTPSDWDGSSVVFWVNAADCEVLAPPVQRDDVVTPDNIGQLGIGSIIREPGCALQLLMTGIGDRRWYGTDGSVREDNELSSKATVVYIGGVS